jgi:hypothetical protein
VHRIGRLAIEAIDGLPDDEARTHRRLRLTVSPPPLRGGPSHQAGRRARGCGPPLPHAVAHHLRKVFTKLDISSRNQLRRVLPDKIE